MLQDEKRKRAYYLIYTEPSLAETRAAVKALVEALRASPEGIR